ncbi:oligosaccharide flippase family protein [Gammaproteobacteria bacterium]|nr:oligosaccharide flippase family protein [Gammaproteobacteria bacterium]
MLSNNKIDILSNTKVYLISNIFLATIPFILLPILTRYLGPEDYGKLAMFQLLITGLGAFVGLGVTGVFQRKFYDQNIKESDLALFLGTCFQTLICTSLLVALSILLLKGFLVTLIGLEVKWMLLSICIIFLQTQINLRLVHWQVSGQAFKYGMTQFAQAFLNMALSIFLVVFFLYGFEGRISALLLAPLCMSFLCFISLKKNGLIKFLSWKPQNLIEILQFGVPLIPHTFGAFIIASADRFFINDSFGLKEVGVYMVAVQLAISVNIVFDALNKAFCPWLYAKLKENSYPEMIKIVAKTYQWFGLILLIGLFGSWFIAPPLTIFIAGKEYSEAATIIGLLIMGQVLGGMYLMVTNYIFYMKRTGLLGLVTIFSGLINIVLLYYLVPILGLKGAAISFLISMIVRFFMTWYLAAKVCPMPWFKFKELRCV